VYYYTLAHGSPAGEPVSWSTSQRQDACMTWDCAGSEAWCARGSFKGLGTAECLPSLGNGHGMTVAMSVRGGRHVGV
jgi:hypothetical protein